MDKILYHYSVMRGDDGMKITSGSITLDVPILSDEDYAAFIKELSKHLGTDNFATISLTRLN